MADEEQRKNAAETLKNNLGKLRCKYNCLILNIFNVTYKEQGADRLMKNSVKPNSQAQKPLQRI